MKIIVLFILIVSATLATSCPNLQHLSTEPNNVESSKQPDNMESGTNVLPFCDSALYTILSLQYNGEELGIFELISESSEFSQCIATEEPLIALSSPATDGSVLALTYFGQVLWVDVQSKAINKVVDFPVQVEEDEEIIDVALAQDAEKVFILTSQYVLSFSLNDPTSSFTKYYFDEPLNTNLYFISILEIMITGVRPKTLFLKGVAVRQQLLFSPSPTFLPLRLLRYR